MQELKEIIDLPPIVLFFIQAKKDEAVACKQTLLC